jgi:hypothetical protein
MSGWGEPRSRLAGGGRNVIECRDVTVPGLRSAVGSRPQADAALVVALGCLLLTRAEGARATA